MPGPIDNLKEHVGVAAGQFARWSTEANEARALLALSPLNRTYLPWSQTSLRPSAVVTLLNQVDVAGKREVVEIGTGLSTVFLARLMEQRGAGHVVSIEQDSWWLRHIEEILDRENLSLLVTMVHAPIKPTPWGLWHDPSPINEAIGDRRPDLLLVDGPARGAAQTAQARYPALPFLADRLSEQAVVILDDAWRRGEREVIRRWERETEFRFAQHLQSGVAVASKNPYQL
jgi:hypothetical protein